MRSRLPNNPPYRMAALSTLPVFLTLAGRRALVVGGSDAAAWKAELLAASGAAVEIIAPKAETGGEMATLIANGAPAGSLRHMDMDWHEADFGCAAVIVADIRSAEALDLISKARAAAVPVNIIDKPDFCDFQFGSIVNRSPVVVGISTSGAAPILGQAVRRRIETLLPMSLAAWGHFAADWRAEVMARLRPGPQRRLFWEHLAQRAFDGAPAEAERPDRLIASLATAPQRGRVSIVGAGPGDAELLTLKAMRVLQSADVIFHDREVFGEVLELARREAKRIRITGHRSIAGQVLASAEEGQHVVRLVAGDVPAAARGTVSKVEAAGIRVEIVPGIASRPVQSEPSQPEVSNELAMLWTNHPERISENNEELV
jgi:uroporphyrin-III C-methyltransferase/precorrin-2 dehydrogenase/sirohydrochlorin ferrochelatase